MVYLQKQDVTREVAAEIFSVWKFPRWSLHTWLVALFLTSATFGAGLTIAAEVEGVEAGREALQAQSYPWYDRQTDDTRTLQAEPYQSTATHGPRDVDHGHLKSLWEWNWNPKSQPAATGGTNVSLPPFSTGMFLNGFGWTLLLLAIGVVTYFLVKSIMRDDELPPIEEPLALQDKPKPEFRIADLPIPIPTNTGDFLAEIRRHYASGDYGLAMVYLFSYQLLQLDQHQIIRLSKGKTNRQ